MPRNSSGTYALPAGNPVVTNTLIQSTWANTTLSDVSTAMTDSLDRNGRGAMLAPLKNVDGTSTAPSLSFSSEGTMGIYRASAGVLGFAIGGALVLSLASTGLTFTTPLVLPLGTAAAPALTFTGNTNTGWYSPGTNQLAVSTNGVQRVGVDATGNVTLATGGLTFTAGQQLTFAATGANLITASHAAGTLALQTGGANTRLSIDAAGLVNVANTLGVGGAPALGKLQVFGGAVVIDNAQGYAAKSSGGAATNLALLDASNNLIQGGGAAIATQQFATGGTVRMTIDGSGNVGIGNTPGARLDVSTGTTNRLRVSETSSTLFFDSLNNAASAWAAKTERAISFNWFSTPSGAPATGMTLDGSGQLGIGAAPGMRLDVLTASVVGGDGLRIKNPSTNGYTTLLVNGTGGSGITGWIDSTVLEAVPAAAGGLTLSTYTGSIVFQTNNRAIRMAITSAGVIQDGGGLELGYKDMPLALSVFERGKCFVVATSQNISAAAAGNIMSIYNNSAAAITLVQNAITLRQGGTANTGNRTLLARGLATIWYVSASEAIVNGNIT